MNIEALKAKFKNDPRIFQIADKLSFGQTQRICLDGLTGSSKEWIMDAVFNHPTSSKLNFLVILNDQEEAAYFHNTLENITNDALNLLYFPASFKVKRNYKLLNSSHVMLRTEALTKLSAASARNIIVTYPEALFEKVVLAKELASNIISIKQAETLDLNGVMELFVMLGFERTDFVYEPGQFALRGGILDIYSFGNEKPYRIELFGNEVDSIRIFDPESQLSERRLLSVNIIPNVDTQFEGGDKVSMLEFLPENTVVCCNDWSFTKERLEQEVESLGIFLEYHADDAKTAMEDEDAMEKKNVTLEDFLTLDTFEKQIFDRHQLNFHGSFAGLPDNDPSIVCIHFETKPQPSFNRNFNLLIADLKNWEKQGYTIYIFAEQAKQLERLYTIFRDLNTEINFVPVPIAIHEGFIDTDLKQVCYTDHQIFQRYHKFKVKQAFSKNKALTLKTLRELQPGDYVTHIDHGVGIYSGLQKVDINGKNAGSRAPAL